MKKILLIDDSEDVLFAEQMVLTRAGFDVHTALGGRQALNILREIKNIDLILLDYEMQPMDGPEFVETLKTQDPQLFNKTKMAFLTAHSQLPDNQPIPWVQKMKDIGGFVELVKGMAG